MRIAPRLVVEFVERSCIRDAGYGSPAKESDTKQSRDD